MRIQNWSESVMLADLPSEAERIRFLRIPEISRAANYRSVVENFKRTHGLPRIHLCGKTVDLAESVRHWLEQRVTCGR